MRVFTIPDMDVEFLQHDSSQAVCEDAYYLYLKAVGGILSPTSREGKKVLDLGTGNGILLLMLAKDFQDLYYTGIEIIKELCDIAMSNFERMCEYLNQRLVYRILNADYSELDAVLKDEKFDLIVSNPPYYPKGVGRISNDIIKATSKFELTANLMQLLCSVKSYLKQDGKSFIIFPFRRNDEFEACCKTLALGIKSFEYIDYYAKSFHSDLEKVNSKTKIIYEVIHA